MDSIDDMLNGNISSDDFERLLINDSLLVGEILGGNSLDDIRKYMGWAELNDGNSGYVHMIGGPGNIDNSNINDKYDEDKRYNMEKK